MNGTAIRAAIFEAACRLGRTGDEAEVDKIKELVALIDNRRSLNVDVSVHATKRYMERSGCKSETRAKARLLSFLDQAEGLQLKDRWKAVQIINHDYREAAYFRHGEWLLVVANATIVTCHNAKAKRWRKVEAQQATLTGP